jgi:hypothetical protein
MLQAGWFARLELLYEELWASFGSIAEKLLILYRKLPLPV